jgi:membrane-associated phospholipid phosphatase
MRRNRVSHCLFGMIFSTILALIAVTVYGQTPAPSPPPSASATPTLERQFFKNILRDQKAIWTAPLHLHKQDARWLAPFGLGTAALIATDRNTGDEIAEFDDQLQASRVVSYPGSTYGAAAIAGTFYLAGRLKHDARARETGLLGLEALVDSEIVVVSLKAITERRRPRALVHRGDFFKGGRSFPSGHSIHAWSVATVIAQEYSDHRWAQISAYAIASAVSIARYTGEKHFLSDILVGSAMGYGIGRYVYRTHHLKSASSGSEEEEESEFHANRWPRIAPEFNRHAREYGVALAWSF